MLIKSLRTLGMVRVNIIESNGILWQTAFPEKNLGQGEFLT